MRPQGPQPGLRKMMRCAAASVCSESSTSRPLSVSTVVRGVFSRS